MEHSLLKREQKTTKDDAKNIAKRFQLFQELSKIQPKVIEDAAAVEDERPIIGPNGTRTNVLNETVWKTATEATHMLLLDVFGIEELATRTILDVPGHTFHGRVRRLRMALDPLRIQDIFSCVLKHFPNSEKEVLLAIRTKCAQINEIFFRENKSK